MIKKALTKLYQNLSYVTLSGVRELEFAALSDLVLKLSFLLKAATMSNIEDQEKSDAQNAYNINKDHVYVPKQEDRLDVVIDILDEPVEHKKMMHPYVSPQVETADVIETKTKQVDDEFDALKADYDQINNAANEQKKQNEISDLVDYIIDESNPFQDLGIEDIWIEDNIFDNKDDQDIVDVSKDILKRVKESDPYLDFKIPTDAIIDDLFEPLDNEYDKIITDEPELIIADPVVPEEEKILPNTNNVSLDTGPKQSKKYITTQLNSVVRSANKIKEKYKKQHRKKQIG